MAVELLYVFIVFAMPVFAPKKEFLDPMLMLDAGLFPELFPKNIFSLPS